ncbi:MAG: glycosyltransferase family 2 protein, partial [Pseudoxanthomonas sp.]
MAQDRLTIVISARNEEATLPRLHPRIRAVLDRLDAIEGRVLYVDDGSTDRTWEVMQHLAATDAQVELLRLSRNFGKEAALTAGLDLVDDGAAVILDADGQDPPELIPQFVSKWREGYDDVHGTRIQ